MSTYTFKFISGKYQGGDFPVPQEGDIVVGRAADVDMVLVEDMVSRRHAKITISHDGLSIVDLGSTNGTFVNGEKVLTETRLKLDDRVLIGTSILKVAAGKPDANPDEADDAKTMMSTLAQRAPQDATMSGDLGDVPLPDLLQLFGTNKKTGVVTMTYKNGGTGTLFLREGKLVGAEVLESPALTVQKAVCRMLNWNAGHFKFDSRAEVPADTGFSSSCEVMLMEATHQNDETERAMAHWPTLACKLAISQPLQPMLSDLEATELDVFQLSHNVASVQAVLDDAAQPDAQVLTILRKLVDDEYLVALAQDESSQGLP